MKISFYNGVSGLVAYQEELNRVSNNVANANTVGFKPSQSTFSALLHTRMAVNSEPQPLTGHGVKIQDPRLLCQQGAALQTGHPLDFALMGEGFFAVERPDGSTAYTRSGAFDISMEGDSGYLVTSDGAYVLDRRGRRIEVEPEDRDGPLDLEGLAEQIGVYAIPNPYGLEPVGGNCYVTTAPSGEAEAMDEGAYQLLQGTLEQSAVNLSDEMVSVIAAQRAFRLNAKLVQTADELEQTVNNLR